MRSFFVPCLSEPLRFLLPCSMGNSKPGSPLWPIDQKTLSASLLACNLCSFLLALVAPLLRGSSVGICLVLALTPRAPGQRLPPSYSSRILLGFTGSSSNRDPQIDTVTDGGSWSTWTPFDHQQTPMSMFVGTHWASSWLCLIEEEHEKALPGCFLHTR